MRVIQMLPTLSFGDAVGNDARAIEGILREKGYETGIYADNIDPRLPRGTAKKAEGLGGLSDRDILIYHASTGTEMNYTLPKYGGRQVMVYHNITPAHFFSGYSEQAYRLTSYGYEGMRFLADKMAYCIADSEYNRQELIRMGYKCPIDVCPILIPFEDYRKTPDPATIRKYREDGGKNILFVGRLAPNKKQEDVIRAFRYYQKYFEPKARLFLVGSSNGMEKYERQLRQYAAELGIADKVVFPGHIRFEQILAYYQLADLFLCMSEHEGFCVPLVEAMFFKVPIIAYRSSAIPETLGEGGLLLDKKDPELAAAAMDRVIRDGALREYLMGRQQEKLKEFSYEAVRKQFLACLGRMTAS